MKIFWCLALLLALPHCMQIYKTRTYERGDRGIESLGAIPKNNYPVRLAWVNRSPYWYGDNIAKGWGVPGYAPDHIFNYIVLTFWGCSGIAKDMVQMWRDAKLYFGDQTKFGGSSDEIQKSIKALYNKAGIKIMVSAFGDSEFPTSAGADPAECGKKFGQFVLDNNFDGADVDWEDNTAMNRGTGEEWLITFTKALRETIPDKIITHSPQAPYFKNEFYTNKAYIAVHKAVGKLINFYNVQFYNQVDSRYDTYEELFIHATGEDFNGTAVQEIVKRGVPARQLVVGKPATTRDVSNTGYMEIPKLEAAIKKGYDDLGFYSGVAFWQYASDADGAIVKQVASYVKQKCAETKACH